MSKLSIFGKVGRLVNLGSPRMKHPSVLHIPSVASGFGLIKSVTQIQTKQSHKSRGEGHSRPRTRNTNEENSVCVNSTRKAKNQWGNLLERRWLWPSMPKVSFCKIPEITTWSLTVCINIASRKEGSDFYLSLQDQRASISNVHPQSVRWPAKNEGVTNTTQPYLSEDTHPCLQVKKHIP